MEPGLIDRDHLANLAIGATVFYTPQWSPVLSTGITRPPQSGRRRGWSPQWSPVLSTGITGLAHVSALPPEDAAMEPGLIDRDHEPQLLGLLGGPLAAMEPGLIDRDHRCQMAVGVSIRAPQWSPVLSTGITTMILRHLPIRNLAAMEPGLIDRDHGSDFPGPRSCENIGPCEHRTHVLPCRSRCEFVNVQIGP